MSSLEFNKIAAAVLTAGVVAMSAGVIANQLFHQEPLEENAFKIDVGDGSATQTAAVAEEDTLESITALLAAADVAAGESLAKRRCGSCHTFDQGGANRVGPNLWNIVMDAKASRDGFSYSSALQAMAGQNWDYDALNGFIASPRNYAPGTKMSYGGSRRASDRANMIAYMRSLSDNPAPLPE